jgi:cytochrome oxidase Cu insertion factor (SCO1/SenC/PrrC family)
MGYAVNHSASSYMVGPGGRLRHVVPHGSDPRKVALAIRQLAAEADPPLALRPPFAD